MTEISDIPKILPEQQNQFLQRNLDFLGTFLSKGLELFSNILTRFFVAISLPQAQLDFQPFLFERLTTLGHVRYGVQIVHQDKWLTTNFTKTFLIVQWNYAPNNLNQFLIATGFYKPPKHEFRGSKFRIFRHMNHCIALPQCPPR